MMNHIILFFVLLLGMNVCQAVDTSIISIEKSSINFPFAGALINTKTPVITGTLKDINNSPINDEAIELLIDNNHLATVMTGQDHGIFSYQVSEQSLLADGQHVLVARVISSGDELAAITFTIDTSTATAPVILTPEANQQLNSSLVSITGVAQVHATVFLFLDGSDFADVLNADDQGHWSTEYTLPNGTHAVYAHAESLAGNPGPTSVVVNFSVMEG